MAVLWFYNTPPTEVLVHSNLKFRCYTSHIALQRIVAMPQAIIRSMLFADAMIEFTNNFNLLSKGIIDPNLHICSRVRTYPNPTEPD